MRTNAIKRIIVTLMIMTLLFSLSACGGGSSYEEGKDIYQLKGISRYGHFHDAYAVDESRAIIRYGGISPEDNPESWMYVQYIALYDVAKDSMIKEVPTKSGNEEIILGTRENGEIITWDMYGEEVFFYKEDLTFDRRFSLPGVENDDYMSEPSLIYDRERDCFFYCRYNKIFEISIEGSASEFFTFKEKNSVKAFDPERGVAVVERNKKKSFSGRVYSIYDVSDGSRLRTIPAATRYDFLDGDLVTMSTRMMPGTDDGKLSDHFIINSYSGDFSEGTALDMGKDCQIRKWGGSFAFAYRYVDVSRMVPLFIDRSSGKAAVPDFGQDDLYNFSGCKMGDSGKYLAACESLLPYIGEGNGEEAGEDGNLDEIGEQAAQSGLGQIKFYVIDPSLLEYDETLESVPADSSKVLKAQKKANLKMVRAFTDEIEDKYNVNIFFGDEAVKDIADDSFVMESTDSIEGDPSLYVYEGLEQLKNEIGRYPEGFFDHFKENGGRGVCIYLVRSMDSKYNNFNYAGLSLQRFDDFYVYFDVMELGRYGGIVHHELWHTVEESVFNRDMSAFAPGMWQELNPPGFDSYIFDIDKYEEDAQTLSQYLLDGGEDPYFIRNYSMLDAQEDRATLIEAIFDGYHGETPADSLEAMKAYPHLKAKYKFMAKVVKDELGYVYWEKMN